MTATENKERSKGTITGQDNSETVALEVYAGEGLEDVVETG